MSMIRVISVTFLWLLAAGGLVAADSKADPRENLETALPEAIRRLEAKEYTSFLRDFVSPDDLKGITEQGPLDEFAKAFGEGKAAQLLQVLKSIVDAKPTLNESGNEATYELKDAPSDSKKTITWMKIGEFWYIQN